MIHYLLLMMKHYSALTIAILAEVFATTMLKLSDGLSNVLPTIGVLIGFSISFYALSVTLKTLSLGLAYAIWSGVCTALTAVIGILLWGELFSILKLLGLILIISGVVLLNLSGKQQQAANETAPQ